MSAADVLNRPPDAPKLDLRGTEVGRGLGRVLLAAARRKAARLRQQAAADMEDRAPPAVGDARPAQEPERTGGSGTRRSAHSVHHR